MKKSQLRKLIKEEIKNLQEDDNAKLISKIKKAKGKIYDYSGEGGAFIKIIKVSPKEVIYKDMDDPEMYDSIYDDIDKIKAEKMSIEDFLEDWEDQIKYFGDKNYEWTDQAQAEMDDNNEELDGRVNRSYR